jgi:hypothetical protein
VIFAQSEGYVPVLELDNGERRPKGRRRAVTRTSAGRKKLARRTAMASSAARLCKEWLNHLDRIHKTYSPMFNAAPPEAQKISDS